VTRDANANANACEHQTNVGHQRTPRPKAQNEQTTTPVTMLIRLCTFGMSSIVGILTFAAFSRILAFSSSRMVVLSQRSLSLSSLTLSSLASPSLASSSLPLFACHRT
jgi:hypothetical protein